MTKPLPMPDSRLLDLMADIQQRGSEEAVATLAMPYPQRRFTPPRPDVV